MSCYYHPDRQIVTHTMVVVDSRQSKIHETVYKRVEVCYMCYLTYREQHTSRVEEIRTLEDMADTDELRY